MDTILIELAKQTPALLVLAGIVYVFLKHIREERESRQVGHDQRDATIREIAKESAETSKACAASMAESSEVMRQCTTALARVNESRHWSGSERATKP